MTDDVIPFSYVVGTGSATLALAAALAYVVFQTSAYKRKRTDEDDEEDVNPKALGNRQSLVITRDEYPGGQVFVYYGTQTGTAESFARQLEREGPEHGFFVHVVDLEDCSVEDLVDEHCIDGESGTARAVFLTATYGEGEAPDNSTAFVNALKERANVEIFFEEGENSKAENLTAPESCLVGLDYCVFGLGNRQYDHFNAMGKFFDHAVARVGGNRLAEVGLGNDDDDLEADFENWKDNVLWPTLKKAYISESTSSALKCKADKASLAKKVTLPDCQYDIEYFDGVNGDAPKPEIDLPLDKIHGQSRLFFTAVDCPVTIIRELRSSEDPGSTVHVEVDISEAKKKGLISYHTADNLGVLPINELSVVESVASSLNYDLDRVFLLKRASKHEWHGAPFPMPISVRECLTRYCDLTSAPRRSELKLLASYAKDPIDQKALLRMASKEGKNEYKEKILGEYVGLAELLRRCPSIEMPLEHFLNMIPTMQARFFTISSSSSVHPDSVHLTVSVTTAERKDGSIFKGLCSNHIAGSKPTAQLRVFNRPSTFRLPEDCARPIIMIGPGTGVAPMRALLQQRRYERTVLNKQVGPNVLYFGCKRAAQDYLYREEIEAFQKSGDLQQLHLAFSREKSEKVYVQHLLLRNADDTWKLVDEQGAYIYVCGGVKMGHDVSEALKEIFALKGNLTGDEPKEYLSKLTKQARFVQELWA